MITLEPYQERAVEWLRYHRRGLVQIPAGGGKTIVAAAALERIVSHGMKIGWLAPTVETRNQALKAIAQFPALAKIDVKVQCATRGVDMSDRHLLIVDECKHALAPTWFNIISRCQNRWGFDATPKMDEPDRDKGILILFGGNLLKIEREEVGRRLVQGVVRMIDASDPVKERIDAEIKRLIDHRKRFSRIPEDQLFIMAAWRACASVGIAQNKARTQAAVDLALKHHGKDQVLILVNQIAHGEEIAAAIGTTAQLVHSKIGRKQRASIMQAVRDGFCRCLIATSLADEGLDLPSLNVLIMVSGGRSKVKAEQRTGRVLRSFGDKDSGIIYDFLDTQHPTMANQSRKRVALYRSLGYQVENYPLEAK